MKFKKGDIVKVPFGSIGIIDEVNPRLVWGCTYIVEILKENVFLRELLKGKRLA